MTTEQLLYLIEIYTQGSMSKASDILHLSPQGLSMSMNALENELGVQLLKKTNKGSKLTEVGIQLVELSNRFLSDLHEIISDQKDKSDGLKKEKITGETDLYLPHAISESIFTVALSKLYKIYPHLKINTQNIEYSRIIPQVLNHQIPFAMYNRVFVNGEDILNDIPKELTFYPVLTTKYCCHVEKKHVLSDREIIAFKDIQSYPLIIPKSFSFILTNLLNYFKVNPQIIYADSVMMVNELLKENIGVAI